MSNKCNSKSSSNQPPIYQIRVEGHLGSQWTDWFEGLTITLHKEGDTIISGPVADQAALHGLLKKIRDSGLSLVSVFRVQYDETHPAPSEKEIKK
ncbi:MAG TPA: hypothetical protein PJ988_10495 [Anaerolinea sp.]|nr:hypothetical protein [Anaerolinea sp.]